ncbi:MAG: hypothetical protein D6715_01730 [Calditrichaeota bacterium]|nr:MAG: hypothetical protein D6715_01730 [Calditrichota bacterium]
MKQFQRDRFLPVENDLSAGAAPSCTARKIRRSWFIWLLMTLVPATLLAQQLGTEAQREKGRQIYMKRCAQCHGEKGDGRGPAHDVFLPHPRDFTSGLFKIRTTPSGELPTDEDLHRVIRKGMPYTGMPAWPSLSDDDITNLIYFIKTFNEDFASPYAQPTPIKIPEPPAFTQESVERGRKVYEANRCYDCHGNQGRGDGKSAPTLTDEWGDPIRPADLTKRWTFRGGGTRKDIYRTFTTGMNGTPMPSYEIPENERWDLVNYVYSLSRDDPNYATMVSAVYVPDSISLAAGRDLFAGAPPALFPVVGQVIEPGREFYPGVNAIEVRAVYNASKIALLLTWHDMVADRAGSCGPGLPVPRFDPQHPDTAGRFCDAVAVQFPSEMPSGQVKPYFLFGDSRHPVDLWFADLGKNTPRLFEGKGSGNLSETDKYGLEMAASYNEGEWAVIFVRDRQVSKGLSFQPNSFVPIAFSVWDGFNHERGNKRGITSWYYLYLPPMNQPSPVAAMAKYGALTLVVELVLIVVVRTRYREEALESRGQA